jgi:hypothetical protein
MEDKDQSMELVLRKGFNAADAQGFRMNFNNQRNLSTNLQVSRQRISHYDIPGNSKAGVCNTGLFPPPAASTRRWPTAARKKRASSRSTTRPRSLTSTSS